MSISINIYGREVISFEYDTILLSQSFSEAATASVFDLTLITTDQDFDHLNGVYIHLERIDIENFKKER